MAELRGLGEVSAELERQGGRLLAISVDQPAQARRVVQRNKLNFDILCDTDRAITRTYGVAHEGAGPDGQDIPLPAHFLINRDGTIAWKRVATKIQDRPHPNEVLDAVRRLTDVTVNAARSP